MSIVSRNVFGLSDYSHTVCTAPSSVRRSLCSCSRWTASKGQAQWMCHASLPEAPLLTCEDCSVSDGTELSSGLIVRGSDDSF